MTEKNNDYNFEDIGEVKPTTERFRIMVYYIILFGSLILTCTPSLYTSLCGILICGFTIAAVYSARFNSEEDSLIDNHMTYLIHTFWYTMLFLLYSVIAAGTYLLLFANYHVVGSCLSLLPNKLYNAVDSLSLTNFMDYYDSCAQTFGEENTTQLLITTLIAFLPVIMYLFYRFIKGWIYLSKTIHVPMKNE